MKRDPVQYAAEDRMQEIAQAELESCHPRFVDWLCENHDLAQFAALISAAVTVEGAFAKDAPAWDNLRAHADRLRDDYWRWRMTRPDFDDIYAECDQEAAEVAQDMQDGQREAMREYRA